MHSSCFPTCFLCQLYCKKRNCYPYKGMPKCTFYHVHQLFPPTMKLNIFQRKNRAPQVFFLSSVLGYAKQNCPAEEIHAGFRGAAWEQTNGTGEPAAVVLSTRTITTSQPDPNQVERVERKQSCQQARHKQYKSSEKRSLLPQEGGKLPRCF